MPSRACQGLADPAKARFTCARLDGGQIEVATEPVAFTRLRPGETLLETKKSAG